MAYGEVTTHFSIELDRYYDEQIKPTLDRLAAATTTAATATAVTTAVKPAFDSLPADLIQQLRLDGTYGEGLRSIAEARALYDSLPNSLDSIQDIRDVVASRAYEAGHIIPHAHGGAATADNIAYMPSDLNRHIGDRVPTQNELDAAQTAVTNEGYLGNNPLLESAVDLTACATAPVVTRLTGSSIQLVGGMVRNDQAAISKSLTELPDQLATGAVEGITRGVPAYIGGSLLGPVGAVGGLVACDFIEAATTTDDSVRFTKCMEGSAKAGVAAVLICNPPLAAVAGAGWLIGKFFNAW